MSIKLPELTYAYSLEIADASDIDLSGLQSVSSSFSISGNDVQGLAFADLSFVGGDLSISNSPLLKHVDFGELVSAQGDLKIVDNSQLVQLDGFAKLNAIGGSLEVRGQMERYGKSIRHNPTTYTNRCVVSIYLSFRPSPTESLYLQRPA